MLTLRDDILSVLSQKDVPPLTLTDIACKLRHRQDYTGEKTYKLIKELENEGLVVYDRQYYGWRITPQG